MPVIYCVLIGTATYGKFINKRHAEKYAEFLHDVEGVEARIVEEPFPVRW